MTSRLSTRWLMAAMAATAVAAISGPGGATRHADKPQPTTGDPLAPRPLGTPAPPSDQLNSTYKPIVPSAVRRAAPIGFDRQLEQIGRSFNGIAGISVLSVDDGWQASWNGSRLFPQQSVSKLWVSITALDAVDRGEVNLSQRRTIGRDDLTLFHQPLRDLVIKNGSYTTTLDSLLNRAITQSDNTANDSLMNAVGGPVAVRAMISRKRLGDIRFYDGERALQTKIAGLTWRQSYAIGNAFYDARRAVPVATRRAAFESYVADPYDGASPDAVSNALARLYKGELLSAASTRKLLDTMGNTRTGKMRVRAGLSSGWNWLHKTGTGQVFSGRQAGINDIGILKAPDGSAYAVAIFTVANRQDGSAQEMMQNVAKAVIASHRAGTI